MTDVELRMDSTRGVRAEWCALSLDEIDQVATCSQKKTFCGGNLAGEKI